MLLYGFAFRYTMLRCYPRLVQAIRDCGFERRFVLETVRKGQRSLVRRGRIPGEGGTSKRTASSEEGGCHATKRLSKRLDRCAVEDPGAVDSSGQRRGTPTHHRHA